jgi:hypothetical protein
MYPFAGAVLDVEHVRMNTICGHYCGGDPATFRRTGSVQASPKACLAGAPTATSSTLRPWQVAIGPPKTKTFEAEGEVLQRTLTKCLRERNEAIKGLAKAARRFRDSIVKEDCKPDYPHAMHALMKELERAEELFRD